MEQVVAHHQNVWVAVRFRHMARRQVFLWKSAWQRADAAQPSMNHTFLELPCGLISEGAWQRINQLSVARIVILFGKDDCVLPCEQPAQDAISARVESARLVINTAPAKRVDQEVIATHFATPEGSAEKRGDAQVMTRSIVVLAVGTERAM